MRIVEKCGDIVFLENKKGKLVQIVPPMGTIPVWDGKIKYKVLKKLKNCEIVYNLNGLYGYCIRFKGRIIEDRFWSFDKVQEAVRSLKLD